MAGLAIDFLPFITPPNTPWLAPHEWCLAIAAAWSLAWLAWRGVPRTISRWCEFLTWNALFVFVAGLHLFRMTNAALAWGLMISLRTAVGLTWAFVVLGLPIMIVALVRHRRQQHRQPFFLGRLWFAAALTLGLLELACGVWEAWRSARLNSLESARLSFPHDLPDPPAGEWHLAAIGESSMLGWPYEDFSSIPRMTAWRLQSSQPAASLSEGETRSACPQIVVHNLAIGGVNLPQAIKPLQTLHYRPHMLLVYAGHNEFYHELEGDTSQATLLTTGDDWFNRSPTFRVWNRVLIERFPSVWRMTHSERLLIDRPLLTDEQLAMRLKRFRFRLEQLAEFCRREQIATVWFVPAASENGFEPNRSVVSPGCSAATRAALLAGYAEARAAERQGDWSRAAAIYRRGLTDEPHFAEFHYRLGQCLLHLGDVEAAREHLTAALEGDAHPARMLRDYREAVRDVATQAGFPVIDADAVLRPHTPHGILDRTLFLDDVHPTLKGQFLLADAAAERLAPAYAAACDTGFTLRPATLSEALTALHLDADKLAKAYTVLAEGFVRRGVWRFDQQARLEDAARLRTTADQLRRGEIALDQNGIEELE
jgi:hypothetical protein